MGGVVVVVMSLGWDSCTMGIDGNRESMPREDNKEG